MADAALRFLRCAETAGAPGADAQGVPGSPRAPVYCATHPRIWEPPTPLEAALDQLEAWLESPAPVLLAEEAGHGTELRRLLEGGRIAGPRVHDARIAALCLAHGVRDLWAADRDFSRFPSLPNSNPLAR